MLNRLRRRRLLLGLTALLLGGVAAACWFAADWFDLALPPIGVARGPAPTPVVWSSLPAPVVTHPG